MSRIGDPRDQLAPVSASSRRCPNSATRSAPPTRPRPHGIVVRRGV